MVKICALYPEERTKGSFKCGSKRCEVCLNVNETSTFASTVTGETYINNHKFNCNGKCLVYLLTCNCCKKQYVSQTAYEFRFRWNNCKSNYSKHQRGETCMQQHLYEHFWSSNHNYFISDVSVTFIDKTDPSFPLTHDTNIMIHDIISRCIANCYYCIKLPIKLFP